MEVSLPSPGTAMAHADASGTGSWDWQRELDNLGSRTARGRSEEAAACRRSAEEAERAALRRIEDVERQLLRCQAEESSALHGFLAGWNNALEARLERHWSQCSCRFDAIERRATEEAERTDLLKRQHSDIAADCQKAAESASEAACEGLRLHVQEDLEALRREVLEEATARELKVAEVARTSSLFLTERIEATESMSSAVRRELETVVQKLSDRLELAERATESMSSAVRRELETVVHKLSDRLELAERASATLRQDFDATFDKQVSQVDALRSRVETSHQGFRLALENSEKRAAESSSIVSELNALRGHYENGMESQGRMTAETCTRLESELREMVDMATERAELAAASLDSKVAGALDAVMDARVAKCAKDCTDEVSATKSALEAKLRTSEVFAQQLLKQESQASEVTNAEFAHLREELYSFQKESAEDLRNITASCGRLSSDLRRLQTTALSHEWCIPRCLHRIRYLSMSSEAGLWLDSDPFSLGALGPLTLRLYPRGVRGGDGQCAVELRMAKDAAASCSPFTVPTCVDLSVSNLRSRAAQSADRDGDGLVWLAEALGDVEQHAAKSGDDLHVGVGLPQLPVLPGGSVDAAAGLNELLSAGVAESMTVPQGLEAALQQRRARDTPASPEKDRGPQSDVVLAAGNHLLSQDTLVNDDMSSTVTVGSESNSSSSRRRTQWTVEGGQQALRPSARSADSESAWTRFPDALGRSVDSASGKSSLPSAFGSSVLRGSGATSAMPGSPALQGAQAAQVPGRTNPFDFSNPFDAAASPTPSFASPPESAVAGSVPATSPGVARLRGEVPTVSPV